MSSSLRNEFKGLRWRSRGLFLVQLLLLLSLLAGLNTLAYRHFYRTDLTDRRLYSLSAETVAYLQNLENPVEIHVTIPPNETDENIAQMYRDVRGLLREYEYRAGRRQGRPLLEVQFHNVYRQRRDAEILQERFGISEPNFVIFASGDRVRLVDPGDLYQMIGKERSSFQGERVFTSAILDVSSSRQTTIYFTMGHGEMDPGDTDPMRGLSYLADALSQRNMRLAYLDLMHQNRVPEDADLVIIAGPQVPLLRNEASALRTYLQENQGRVILLLEPARRHGLDDLLFHWGILAEDMIIFDDGTRSTLPSGDLIINRYGDHPITRPLYQNNLSILIGLSRPVRPEPAFLADESLDVQVLLGTSDTAWGKRNYREARGTPHFDPDNDLPGPLGIAVLAERRVPSQLGIDLSGGRIVVFGMSDFISNQRIVFPNNFTLFMNTLNWMLDRDSQVNIPPRQIQSIDVVMTREQSQRLGRYLSLYLPGFVAFFGLAIFWIRRK